MNVLCVQHVDEENLGTIQQWLDAKGYRVDYARPYRDESLPDLASYEFIILLGGSQSVNELIQYPYLKQEMLFLKQAIAQKKLILGICLGAQLIGKVLGGEVIASRHKEIGQFPIMLTEAGTKDPVFSHFAPQLDVIHWHGEMVKPFSEITILATSSACSNQAFRYGNLVYGIQFHLELVQDAVQQLIAADPDYIRIDQFVQTPEELLKINYEAYKPILFNLLDQLHSQFQSAQITQIS